MVYSYFYHVFIYINKIEDVRMSEINGRPNRSTNLAEILNKASLCTPERPDDSFIPPTLTPTVKAKQSALDKNLQNKKY